MAQPSLNLKTRRIDTPGWEPVSQLHSPKILGRGHLLLQFDQHPSAETVQELTRRGIIVLEAVPENGLAVSLAWPVPVHGLGLRYAAPIDPADKISPLIAADYRSGSTGYYLVEFQADVDLNYARGLL